MNNIIVSAYFKIPSKKGHNEYVYYLQRFFRSIRHPLIFFTTEDVKNEIIRFGYNLTNINFQIMKLEDLKAWNLGKDFWLRQGIRDVEKYHTPELAAIWYEKKEFVKRAIEIVPNNVYIWCDAGCIRNDESEIALKEFGTRSSLNDDKIHLQHIHKLPYKKFYTYPDVRIAGAIIVGNSSAWNNYSKLYDIILKEYDNAGISCNMDQYIISSSYDLLNNLFVLHVPPKESNVDQWFFFLGII